MSYRYINHDQVAALIRSGAKPLKDWAVVDVRDDDRAGGHIPGSIHAPSELRTEESVQELVKQLEGVPQVIFHCALSQVRGPKAARIYAEALAASQQSDSTATPTTGAVDLTPASAAAARSFSPNPFDTSTTASQSVLVLRDGFQGWQGLYRNDPQLVEAYDEKLWKDYV